MSLVCLSVCLLLELSGSKSEEVGRGVGVGECAEWEPDGQIEWPFRHSPGRTDCCQTGLVTLTTINQRPAKLRDLIQIRIGRACPLLVAVKRLTPLMTLSGSVYRLASSMSDHTPVLFNVFEDWNPESVVLHISFDSIRIQFERKRPIRRSILLTLVISGLKRRSIWEIEHIWHKYNKIPSVLMIGAQYAPSKPHLADNGVLCGLQHVWTTEQKYDLYLGSCGFTDSQVLA